MLAARTTIGVAALLLLNMATAARANDIEDFFKSLRGGANRRPPQFTQIPVGHERGHGPIARSAALSSHRHDQYRHDRYDDHRHDRRDRFDHHRSRSDWRTPVATRSGTQLSLRISSGGPSLYGGSVGHPAAPTHWPQTSPHMMPIQPNPGQMHGYPIQQGFPIQHQLGDIVTCHVQLATFVRVEDAHKIAPNAVPVIVAVRDPRLPSHHTGHHEQLVYVEVFVPQCPLRKLTVSPCRTRIEMDYGDYEVDIRSRNGMIVIEYDD